MALPEGRSGDRFFVFFPGCKPNILTRLPLGIVYLYTLLAGNVYLYTILLKILPVKWTLNFTRIP